MSMWIATRGQSVKNESVMFATLIDENSLTFTKVAFGVAPDIGKRKKEKIASALDLFVRRAAGPRSLSRWRSGRCLRQRCAAAQHSNSKLSFFANFWRARSQLHQNENLQENIRLIAFFKLHNICILLHRCNLKISAKNRFEKSAFFVKIQQKFCKCCKICKILPYFKNCS